MRKKSVLALTTMLVGISVLAAGCSGFGHVTINKESSSSSTTSQKRAASKERSSSLASSKAMSASASVEALGKTYTYGLPYGPSWLYVYYQDQPVNNHFETNKQATVKVPEHAQIKVGGTLPIVGEVLSREAEVSDMSSAADMNESSKYDYKLTFPWNTSGENHFEVNFGNLTNANQQALAKQAFSDLPKYLAALSTNDKKKLPNQSKQLVTCLDGDNTTGDVTDKYQVLSQYYDQKSSLNSGDIQHADHQTYVSVGDDTIEGVDNATELNVQVFAKVKKTDVDQMKFRTGSSDKYGETKLYIEEYQLEYHLVNHNKEWQLQNVVNQGEDTRDIDASGSNWIVQKN